MPLANGDLKVCSACRSELPLSSFDKNAAMKDGLNNQCNACARESRRRMRDKDPDKYREYQKAWNRRQRYGVSPDQYAEMVERTGGLCEVCGSPPTGKYKSLDVDHCHDSGRVRGLLCRPCNYALGYAMDDPSRLRALAEYLEARSQDC